MMQLQSIHADSFIHGPVILAYISNTSTQGIISHHMHESSCLFKKQVIAILNWSSGKLCGPWASCLFISIQTFFPYFDFLTLELKPENTLELCSVSLNAILLFIIAGDRI